MRRLAKLFIVCVALSGSGVLAVEPDEILADPAVEARARAISAELRCLVCQNQSIDDSDAPLARDLRVLVRDRLKNGDTNQQAVEFIVARYGDFVLLRPPFSLSTALLWLTPALLFLSGAFFIWRSARKPAAINTRSEDLSEEEKIRLKDIIVR
ncbi:MAG: cytochrome c-type biogenesis protein CcmH [Chitinophagales bacterium]|nr:cytochrome c-type biogenesis protein CcmH [Hyphomicrobiales bacterium]